MKCRECEALLAGTMSSGKIVCTDCGAVNRVIPVDDLMERVVPVNQPGELECPCCMRRMALAIIEDELLEMCVACHGVLFEQHAFDRLFGWGNLSILEAGPNEAQDGMGKQSGCRCPVCRSPLEPSSESEGSPLAALNCPACRLVWLGGSELAGLQRPDLRRHPDYEASCSSLTPLLPSAEQFLFRVCGY